MDTKKLRQKILDLAIRGKLVPQDPNDEPASVLLERIREEKKQMVKEGKLKAKDIKNDTIIFKGEDNLHYEKFHDGTVKCIEDEIPFEVPKGWCWCRLKALAAPEENAFVDGPFGSNLKTEHYTEEREVRIIQLNNIGDLEWRDNGKKYTTYKHAETLERCKTYPGDIVIAKMMPAGRAIIVPDNEEVFVISSDCVRLRLPNYINHFFIMCAINSSIVNKQVLENVQGIGRTRTSLGKMREVLVPIPSYQEQTIITNMLKAQLNNIDNMDYDIEKLKALAVLSKDKILDMAIKGKLVPQNSNDEPASVLLERIRNEKEGLIKQGKLKRDKKESIIYKGDDNSYYEKFADGTQKNIADEIPFDLPAKWQWCRLKHIGNIIGGGTPKTAISDYWDGDIPWITPADLSGYDDIFISSGSRNISIIGLNKSSAQLLPEGTVLFSSRAPIGYTAIASNEISTNQGFKSFVPATSEITSKYIYYCLKARCDDIVMRASGTTFKEISGSEMAETLIPLPPRNEQERITEYIVSLNDYISSIEANLS